VAALTGSIARSGDLRLVDLQDIGPHYATTLRHWAERFGAVPLERLEELGFDERVQRLWRLYLAYMEAGFRERRISDVHLMLAGDAFRGEAALLARASAPVEAPGDEVQEERRTA
jgi:cyclopropane-fatty-acyl-phospholipid synthase